ncbi:MAG: phosphoribosylformylglycinamidine synthase subunit PurS [Ferruginibacter sp.]
MIYNAMVKIMPLKELLDPQGKAVMGGLNSLGINAVNDVRVGKHIDLQIEASSKAEAHKIATEAAIKLLANQVMETFEVSIN